MGKCMIVYHGSDVVVEKPVLLKSKRKLDFGAGFYTTTNIKQAISFAHKVMLRNGSRAKAVSIYEFNVDSVQNALNVLLFNEPNEEWLDFVFANRQGNYAGKQYDIVIGPVADDTIYRVFGLSEAGLLTRDETIRRLKIHKLYDQVTFCTNKALTFLLYKAQLDIDIEEGE